jgi:hypothetical protein
LSEFDGIRLGRHYIRGLCRVVTFLRFAVPVPLRRPTDPNGRREYRKIVGKIDGWSQFRLDRGFMEMSCALAALVAE